MALRSSTTCVPLKCVKSFIINCIKNAGGSEVHGKDLAEVLVAADYRGHFSHGLNRLGMYVNDIKRELCVGDGQPTIEKETAATALVNGNNLLGAVIGKYCMKLAIQKAKESGVGWVAARCSNHYGIAGYYGLMAAEKGLIGMSMTNTSPLVIGTRSKDCTLGTNPLSFVAPSSSCDNFALDMATTTVSYGKIEIQHRKGQTMPKCWGADTNGEETDIPEKVLNGGGLLPLGGAEYNGGYKGYGLAMMVEILSGILSGSQYGSKISRWGSTDRDADLGHCFIAVDPSKFFPGFEGRLEDFLQMQRNLDPSDPSKPVLVAGDPERIHMKKCNDLGGIPYPSQIVDVMNKMGEEINVEAMKPVV